MQKDKHNIFSKEELLKLIKDGKNAPADMDEFDLEALEGLKLLEDPTILNKLNKEIDEVVVAEKKKENQRKTIYYFSAAASLLLIVSLVFFFKSSDIVKNEKVVAQAEPPKKENTQIDLAPPAQAETPTTYEAKEPEQTKTISSKKETTILAENTAKQKSNEARNLEQTTTVNTKNQDLVFSKDADQEIAANQSVATNSGATAIYKENQELDESKVLPDKAKKEVAPSQSAIAFESADKNNNVIQQTPAAPKADSKTEEEKAQPNMFAASSLAKSKTTKTVKEPMFIGGDSAFAMYTKQHLKISSPTNSGIIVVEFLITKNGTPEKITILKPLVNCDACSKDIIDFIKSIKKWQPATENGKAISATKKINLQYN